jgi:hypothetical protein
MSRRRRQRDVVDLLQDDGFVAYQLAHGRVVALRQGERPRLIHVAATHKSPRVSFRGLERRAFVLAARQGGADPVIAWWPRGRPVPEWIPI